MTTLKEAIEKQLERAVDAKLSAADKLWEQTYRLPDARYPSILEMADDLYAQNADLMEEAKKQVLLDRLYWLFKRRKAAKFAIDFRQIDLPGLDLPRTVYLKNGSRPRIELCTARQIDEGIKVLEAQARERQNPKIARLKIAREMMESYLADTKGITWGEVKQKELERRDFERLLQAE
jgi:hypothetical protein